MIEANDNMALVVEQQISDIQAGQNQYQAIAEGREVHPLEIARAQPVVDEATAVLPTATTLTLQEPHPPTPPPDPDKAMRHLRLSVVVILTLALFLLWLRQRRH